jgi:two-component system, OmpR family, sensor kinase
MRFSLYHKLAIVLLALFLVVTGLFFAITLYSTRLSTEEVDQKVNRGLAATIAREKPVMGNGWIDWKMLDSVFDALMAVNPTIEIYLLNEKGEIIAFSAPPGKVKRKTVSLGPIQRFLRGDRLPIRGDDPRDATRQKIFSVARIRDNNYLYVILGGEHYDSVVMQLRSSYILQQSAVAAVAGVLFAFAAGLLLFAAMTRRLRRLAGAMESFKRSDFTGEPLLDTGAAKGGPGDEVDVLATTFEEMANRIVLQVKQLKEVDLHRRELMANVSHDLRTPLASLRGYVDTLLLKEGQLSAQEQRRFLEIASRHSERLGRLVDELFELSKLDAQVTPLRAEPFSMPELVQDVVQKFQLRAEGAGVLLSADFPRDLPAAGQIVEGDIGLMERVLENLIENAIRYTPSGGSVTVALIPENGKLTVRVTDTGRGIAEESLPHIFERFYRGEETGGGGAGLGLAIARRILELHGATLQAQSRVNAGTTFSFAV